MSGHLITTIVMLASLSVSATSLSTRRSVAVGIGNVAVDEAVRGIHETTSEC